VDGSWGDAQFLEFGNSKPKGVEKLRMRRIRHSFVFGDEKSLLMFEFPESRCEEGPGVGLRLAGLRFERSSPMRPCAVSANGKWLDSGGNEFGEDGDQ
jgi:hypothetical protein